MRSPYSRPNLRHAVAAATVALGASAGAAPVDYNVIFTEFELLKLPSQHREVQFIGSEKITIDVDANSLQSGPFSEASMERSFEFNDPTGSGHTLTFSTDSGVSDCDDDGETVCPESILVTSNYLTTVEDYFRAKGLFSGANELLADATYDFERLSPVQLTDAGISVLVREPASLALGDISGTYGLVVYGASTSRFTGGNGDETIAITRADLTFNGDGTCSGAATSFGEAWQQTLWPDLGGRNVFAQTEGGVDFSGCSYTIDAANDGIDLTLTIPDEDDGDEIISLDMFVSSAYRYMTGYQAAEDIEPQDTELESDYIVAVRRAAAVTNEGLGGVYFLSTFGQNFQSQGLDNDFISRMAIELSGDAPGGNGYSNCEIIGETLAGTARSLAGIVPNATTSASLSSDFGRGYTACRYRAAASGRMDLEFSADGASWEAVQYDVSDDGATMLAGIVTTSEDPLASGVETALTPPSWATGFITLMQKFNGTANDPSVIDFIDPILPDPDPAVALQASVLPGSRSVQTGTTATAFATILNGGTVDGDLCDIQLVDDSLPVNFFYQITDPATNAPLGDRNEPFMVSGPGSQTMFFGITPFAPFDATDVALEYKCLNSNGAPSFVGLNTLLLSASDTPVADIVALGATVTNDGIAHLDATSRSGFFTLASVNVGATDTLTVSVDTGDATLPIVTTICQTDPATAVCINPNPASTDPVSVTIAAGETPTFAVFVSASEDIALDPAGKRIFVRFQDGAGIARGATSVAVQTD